MRFLPVVKLQLFPKRKRTFVGHKKCAQVKKVKKVYWKAVATFSAIAEPTFSPPVASKIQCTPR
jgi:hypothetical protein